jgi:hypothetical protein
MKDQFKIEYSKDIMSKCELKKGPFRNKEMFGEFANIDIQSTHGNIGI